MFTSRLPCTPAVFGLVGSMSLLVAVTNSPATVLLNDTWADASRLETNLPTESAVWVSAAGNVTMSTGSLSYAQSTSSQRLHTYFASPGTPVNLAVGDRLTASIKFYAREQLNNSTSRNFRVGLFYDPDNTHVTADGTNDAGGPGNPFANAQGYAANLFLSSAPGTTQLFQLGKRTGSSNSLLGATGDYVQDASGGGIVAAALNTLYTLQIIIDRTAVAENEVTFKLLDPNGELASRTAVDGGGAFGTNLSNPTLPYFNFDMLAFRLSSSTGTANVLEFTNFLIEKTLIPEPASLGLLGLVGLGLTRRRR